MAYPKGKAKVGNHDPILNIMARAYQAAFQQAEGDDTAHACQARVEIVTLFSPYNLRRLHQQGLISWRPEDVCP